MKTRAIFFISASQTKNTERFYGEINFMQSKKLMNKNSGRLSSDRNLKHKRRAAECRISDIELSAGFSREFSRMT